MHNGLFALCKGGLFFGIINVCGCEIVLSTNRLYDANLYYKKEVDQVLKILSRYGIEALPHKVEDIKEELERINRKQYNILKYKKRKYGKSTSDVK